MNNNNKPPLTEKEAMKKALKRKTRYRMPSINIGVVIITVLFLLIISVSLFFIISDNSTDAPIPTGSESVLAGTDQPADDEQSTAFTVTVPNTAVGEGNLVLVNSEHKYAFPDPPTDVSVYDNKSSSYKVSTRTVTLSATMIEALDKVMDDFYAQSGCRDVMVNSGFRTEEFQRQLYADYTESYGADYAAKYVALPGFSEHHTGLAADLTVYMDSGEGHKMIEYEPCKWLIENFENYGFILRYPEDKVGLTGIDYEPWHYRYVGTPHSLIMKAKDMCLEEYVDYLRSLPEGTAVTWNGIEATEISLDGIIGEYTVYYVPASDGDETEIEIPRGADYTLSGDNVGGFIVTVNGGNTNE